MSLRLGFAVAALVVSSSAFGDTKELPVGLILNAGGGKIVRANTETPLAAKSGDLLFSGDSVKTEAAPATFLFCPAMQLDTLGPQSEVRLDAKAEKIKTGKLTPTPARSCSLPQALRVSAASQQHYGVTMTRGVAGDFPAVPRDKLPAEVVAALKPLDDALRADPNDQAALTAMAALFEGAKLPANALETYNKLRAQWPDLVWIKQKIFEIEEQLGAQQAATAAEGLGGQTFALLVGISKYAKSELALQYAHQDAIDFGKLLSSPRGGGVPAQNLLLLTDEKATTAAVRNGFQDFLKRRAGKKDTVVILMAGHGTVDNGKAFILTHDSDPQDLASTALSVAELQDLFGEQLQRVGRVLLFVDVCKAGTIGTIKSTSVSTNMQALGDADGEMLGLLASRPKEVSAEGPEFGGGHGAFSYYVMKGLQGDADENKDNAVDAAELIAYVSAQVPAATKNKQHPREFGTYENSTRLADTSKPGIPLASFPTILDYRSGEPLMLAQNAPTGTATAPSEAAALRFNAAIDAGRILPTGSGNAFDALRALQGVVNADRYRDYENRLRIALEDKAQQALLKYLVGDETPQTRDDFAAAGSYMEAARQLTKESIYLEGRSNFFQGRAMLFDKNYAGAADLLERSIRFDPAGAYTYNALGIAYLEQGQFDKALPAFRDAAKLAQHWAYPLHNAALAYAETGDYERAIASYRQAIKLAPQYSYLPYNLGLVYQRTNRKKEAEASYRDAMKLAPTSAEPYNALGSLKASQGKRAEAERFYGEALQRKPGLLAARHNLALLLSSDSKRRGEAISLWRDNLQRDPSHLASRLSLAETLAASGDTQAAITEYQVVLKDKPQYTAARVELGKLYDKAGNLEAALTELRQASQADPSNASVFESIGDLEARRGNASAARSSYDAALKLADKTARKRIETKLRKF